MRKNGLIVILLTGLMAVASNATAKNLLDLAREGDAEAVTKALAEGAEIEQRDARGYTPLMVAVFNQQPAVVTVLLDNDAYACAGDIQGNTPLMVAVFNNASEIIEQLMPRCHLDQSNKAGQTPLMIAALGGHVELAKRLLAAGADPDIVDGKGQTASSIAFKKGYSELFELLEAN